MPATTLRIRHLALFIALLMCASINAQPASDTLATDRKGPGGPLKGLHIAGVTAIVGGAGLGIMSNAFNDYPRSGLPFISAGIGLAPTSLVGLGLGSLLARNKSSIEASFQFGTGIAYASPIFSEYVPGNSHRAGVSIQVLSPEIGPWRYRLGFNIFAAEDYTFDDIPAYYGYTRLGWWTLNLDLLYMLSMNDVLTIYPFAGTQFNRVQSEGRKVKDEVLVNYGVGATLKVWRQFSVFLDMQYTLDPDDNPGNMAIQAGVLYSVN